MGSHAQKFPLKNGGQVEVGVGQGIWEDLQTLRRERPAEFESLLALAQGRSGGVPQTHITALRADLFLRDEEGTLVTDVLNVLLSSFLQTPHGSLLINPFRIESQAQIDELQARAGDLDQVFRDMIGGEDEPERG